jgi:hypothetical protein
MRHLEFAALAALGFFVAASAASAQTVTPVAGWLYASQTVSATTQSCIQSAPGGMFIGAGPGFSGNAQMVLFVTESGGERVVMTGLNSIGDCVYDAVTDTLYVTDNGMEAAGSVTGDTVFAVPTASTATALVAVDHELLPAGSIESASGIAMSMTGDLFVGDSVGNGAGSVRRISGGVLSTFAAGFDFVGGLAVDAAGDVYVADSLASFESQISRFDSAGTFQGLISGPTLAHGSYDMVFDAEGMLVVTGLFGGDVVRIDPIDGAIMSFASGFTFAGGEERAEFTGRIQLLSSTFIPEAEDFRVHKLVPVERLVAGTRRKRSECFSEYFGLELVARAPGKPAKRALCVDGDPCDGDGRVNDVCTYPVGFCLNVDDAREAACTPSQVASFQLKKLKPVSAAVQVTAAAIADRLPVVDSTCFFSDGMSVPVKNKDDGSKGVGKGVIKVRVDSGGAASRKDVDLVKLRCVPASM